MSLEKFRSLQDKLLLLDLAVSAHDGNVITAVTFTVQLMTSSSIKKKKYYDRMKKSRQCAVSVSVTGFDLFKEDSKQR